MIKLKERIKILKESTDSLNTKKVADDMLEKFETGNISNAFLSEFENFLTIEMIEKLKDDKDPETEKFIIREKRNLAINNLGIRTAIKDIMESDLVKQPTVGYMVNSLSNLTIAPEFMVVERFLHTIQPLMWNDMIKKHAETVIAAVDENREDINLQTAVKLIENSSSDYLMKAFEKELDDYIINRTDPTRTKLIEKLESYKFDYNIQTLLNILKESSDGFQVYDSKKNSAVDSIYSPVLTEGENSIFYSGNTFFRKAGNNVSILNIEEMKSLPMDFVNLCHFLSQDNVKVQENLITIFSRDKKVEVFEEEGKKSLKVNDNPVTIENFNKIFTNAGIFHRDEVNMMNNVYKVVESFDNIYNIDFGKRVTSRIIEDHFVDIYNLEESIFVHKVDLRNGINEFKETSAIETRELVKDFLKFDIAESFMELLTKEETEIKEHNDGKKEIMEAIEYLEKQKENIQGALDETSSDDKLFEKRQMVSELVEELDKEMQKLKDEYNRIDRIIETTLKTKKEVDECDKKKKDDDLEEEKKKKLKEEKELKEKEEKEKVNEDDTTPGTKVRFTDGKTGVVDSWNDTEGYYIVTMDAPSDVDPETREAKDGEFEVIGEIGEEKLTEALAAGDKIKLKNGAIGSVINVNETDKEVIVSMEDGNTVSIPFDKVGEVEIIDKVAVADSEEEQRQKSSEDGKAVELEEAKSNYVEAIVKDDKGEETGKKVKMDALEYTSKSKREMIDVITENGEKTKIKKKNLKPIE